MDNKTLMTIGTVVVSLVWTIYRLAVLNRGSVPFARLSGGEKLAIMAGPFVICAILMVHIMLLPPRTQAGSSTSSSDGEFFRPPYERHPWQQQQASISDFTD